MRLLVTGAAGFLGRYIVEHLCARGDAVRILVRRELPWMRELGVEIAIGDVRDRQLVIDACNDRHAVIHTAAIASIGGKWQTFYDVNVVGTANILEGCFEHQVTRLVYTSSPSVTFAGVDQNGIDESAPYPTQWLAHYPRSKALAEQMVLRANSPRIATCALRPHLIWGPRDGHLIPRLIDRARRGMLRQVGNGKNLVDSIYVENAAAAHLQALDKLEIGSTVGGSAYFLSQGEPVNCWEWINQILALAELPPVKKRISLRAAYTAGAVLETAYWLLGRTDEPRMTRFLAAQLATSHYFDLSRAIRDFGYHPQINMREGMHRLGEWIKTTQTR